MVDTDACLKTIKSLRKDTLICSERRKEENDACKHDIDNLHASKDGLKAKIEMLTKEKNLLQLKVQACHNTAESLEKEINHVKSEAISRARNPELPGKIVARMPNSLDSSKIAKSLRDENDKLKSKVKKLRDLLQKPMNKRGYRSIERHAPILKKLMAEYLKRHSRIKSKYIQKYF